MLSLAMVRRVAFPLAGTMLMERGRLGNQRFTLASGAATLVRGGFTVAWLAAGGTSGEPALNERKRRPAAAVLSADRRVVTIDLQEPGNLLNPRPRLVHLVVGKVGAGIGAKTREGFAAPTLAQRAPRSRAGGGSRRPTAAALQPHKGGGR